MNFIGKVQHIVYQNNEEKIYRKQRRMLKHKLNN